jgi:hypothetical protein
MVMKKVVKNLKFALVSGDEIIGYAPTITELIKYIGISFSYVYAHKNKNINNDGSWTFNYKGYQYTIYSLEEMLDVFYHKYPNAQTKWIKSLIEKRKKRLEEQ